MTHPTKLYSNIKVFAIINSLSPIIIGILGGAVIIAKASLLLALTTILFAGGIVLMCFLPIIRKRVIKK